MAISEEKIRKYGGVVFIPHEKFVDAKESGEYEGNKLAHVEVSDVVPGGFGFFYTGSEEDARAAAVTPDYEFTRKVSSGTENTQGVAPMDVEKQKVLTRDDAEIARRQIEIVRRAAADKLPQAQPGGSPPAGSLDPLDDLWSANDPDRLDRKDAVRADTEDKGSELTVTEREDAQRKVSDADVAARAEAGSPVASAGEASPNVGVGEAEVPVGEPIGQENVADGTPEETVEETSDAKPARRKKS